MTGQQSGRGWGTNALTELMALLLTVENLEQALQHLAEMAVAVIPDGPSCGITVIRDGPPVTAVYAGSIPRTIHDEQFRVGEGPALEAMRTREAVVVQDMAAERRWKTFRRAALAGGARGIYAHPLELSGDVTGALTLYAHEPDLFPLPVQRVAQQFVLPATRLLEGALQRLSQDEVIGQLNEALDTRTIVGQATGIIMAQRRCGPQAALNVLIRISNDRNIKLRQVALALVEAVASGRELPL